MKGSRLPIKIGVLAAAVGTLPVLTPAGTPAQTELRQRVTAKFEQYRTAIKDAHRIDIKKFKDRLPGGHADAKPITSYELQQLLAGINFERDHTKDNLLALEMAMDHLKRFPDYRASGEYGSRLPVRAAARQVVRVRVLLEASTIGRRQLVAAPLRQPRFVPPSRPVRA